MEYGKTFPVGFGQIYEVGGKVYSVNGKTGAVELTSEDVGALAAGELPNAIAAALLQAKESGEFDGAKGDKGDPGTPGKDGSDGAPGEDGYSPAAKVEETTDGAKITITDKTGTTEATVKNGKDGTPGTDGAPGKDGSPGKDGITPTIGDNGNWYLGDEDTGKPSRGAKGDKGDPGKNGADGKDGAGMDVTGAAVGQIAKISAVDDNGVPTEWEAVDMPSGGGGDETWELIRKIEISEDVSTVKINADESGEPFELNQVKIYVQAYFADSGSNKGKITLRLHNAIAGSTTTYNWPISAGSAEISSALSTKYPACLVAHFCPTPYYIDGNKRWGYTAWYRSQVLAWTASAAYISGDFGIEGIYETRVLDAARCIQIVGSTPFIAGTKIYIFGVRGTVV